MRNRYRLIMGLIPVILALYVVMLPMNRVIEEEHVEIFPFFSWKLFDNVPNPQATEYGVILHSIDGNEVDGTQYLIPNNNIRDWKALILAVEACEKSTSCDSTVEEVVYPIVRRLADAEIVEFSVIEATVDLYEVRDKIRDLANRQTSKTDFFHPRAAIGRWNTHSGRTG